MKNKLLTALGLAALLSASSVTGAFASEGFVTIDSADSTATVSFTDGEGTTTPPVDPEFPEEIIDPDDEDEDGEGGETGHSGALRIDYVSRFTFEGGQIGSGNNIYNAQLVKIKDNDRNITEVPNFVQVSDLRGNGAGWELSVKQNGEFTVEGDAAGIKNLRGADIVISNITANTANIGYEATAAASSLVLNADTGFQPILTAGEDKGIGTHVAHFGDWNGGDEISAATSVQLVLPSSLTPYAEDYQTTLTWILSSVPSNDEDNGSGNGNGNGGIIVGPGGWGDGGTEEIDL